MVFLLVQVDATLSMMITVTNIFCLLPGTGNNLIETIQCYWRRQSELLIGFVFERIKNFGHPIVRNCNPDTAA